MGSFCIRRSGSSLQGDGSCGERCASRIFLGETGFSHFRRISQLTALEQLLQSKKMPSKRGQASRALSAGAAVRAGVLVLRPFRMNGDPNGHKGRVTGAGGSHFVLPALSRTFDSPTPGEMQARFPASMSSCQVGWGGKTKTEGLQYLEPKGNDLLCSPGVLLTPIR